MTRTYPWDMRRPKPSYVPDSKNPANGGPMSLALRELRRNLRHPIFWLLIGAAILLAALAGPYYTLERLSFSERVVYWTTTVVLSTVIMTFLSIFAYRLTEARRWNWMAVSTLAGVAGILPVVATLFLAEGLATGFASGWVDVVTIPRLALSVAPPLIAVTVVVNAFIHYQHPAQASPTVQAPALTLLQQKLPPHLGHDVIAVQAQDHYVEVTTPLGKAMVLMRLGDAVRDLEPLGGMQVHRSWWVNLAHVQRTEKGASGPEVVLSTEQRVPVGRSFAKAFRAAMAPPPPG